MTTAWRKQDEEAKLWAEERWNRIVDKVGRTSKRIGASFPYASVNGQYNDEPSDWWTNGFWPGLLWLIYRETGDERLKAIADEVETKMDEPLQAFEPLHHDVGFMWSLSSVAQYRLTGNEKSKLRALTVASHLAGRFNLKGGFIRAWNPQERIGWAIIDCMMNLGLLYWASETTEDPRFRHVAMAHADMTLRDIVRPDGSTNHIVCFDPETGARLESRGGQGYAPDSAWSRGTAWALYGMAISARYTKEERYILAAKRTAHFFLANVPDNGLPPYDFRAPWEEGMGMDASASLCAADGMLELSLLLPEAEAAMYRDAAYRLLRRVDETCGAWDDPKEEGLMRFSTANFPRRTHVNVPIIYADFFFAEAVCKLRGKTDIFW